MNPLKTHAIVVGIEKYDVSDKWDLNGPALDAARFVKWLRDRGVPAENIKLFATPLEANKNSFGALDVPYHAADNKTITDVLTTDFPNRQGELLLVMWGGHGVIGEGSRRLFFSDANENLLRNLNVSTLLDFCRSSKMPGFAEQVFFLDTCANYFELQQARVPRADVPLDPGTPRNHSQFVLFAAGPGERAMNLTALQKGLFSSILIEELSKSPQASWPPDFAAIETRVEQEFVALRAAGKASQTPVHFYFRDWEGKEDTKSANNQRALRAVERDLVEALLQCPVMDTQSSRLRLLGELGTLGVRKAGSIIPIPDKRMHTETMVAVLAESGELGTLIAKVLEHDAGSAEVNNLDRARLEIEQRLFDYSTIRRLREELDSVELDQQKVARIFRDCGRSLNLGEFQDSREAYRFLMILAGFPKQNNGFPYPALLFLEKISVLATAEFTSSLRNIVDLVAGQRSVTNAIRDFRTGAAWTSTAGIATLVFEMKPKAGGFALRASLLDADGQWTSLPTDDSPVSETAAREKFRELVLEAERRTTNLAVEMAVPRELFCWPIDRWEIDIGGLSAAVGAHYPVVLRWLDRLRDERLQRRWNTKWKIIRSYSGQPLWLQRTDQAGPLLARLNESPESGAFVSFAFSPSLNAEPRGDALTVALSAGTPVAVWLRECDPDPAIAQRNLEQLLTQRNLEELPDVLRLARNKAEQIDDPSHPGCHVAVLFDNSDHCPPRLTG